jgi:hypothetical protein
MIKLYKKCKARLLRKLQQQSMKKMPSSKLPTVKMSTNWQKISISSDPAWQAPAEGIRVG